MGDPDEVDLAGLYRDTRVRLADLVAELDDAALATAVPACPGWAVRDVVAHVAAIADDAVAGRIDGIPSDAHNAGQVARLTEVSVPELLRLWAEVAPLFEEVVGAFGIWPAVIDVASHEQDIRGAVVRPGARDCAAIRHSAANLLSQLWLPIRVCVVTEDGEFVAGPDGPRHPYLYDGEGRRNPGAGPDPASASHDPAAAGGGRGADGPGSPIELTLSTTRFETFRWRMGRRSRAQLAGMRWSGDPAPVLDHLCFFGPADGDIIE